MDTVRSTRTGCNSATVEDAILAEESCKDAILAEESCRDIRKGGTVGCSMASTSPGVVLAGVVW